MRFDARGLDRVGVVVAQRHEQHLFAEAPNIVTAVFFRCAQDCEVFAGLVRMRAVARPMA